MKDDIPLPFGLPAAALKYAPCRVSRLQAVNDRFQSLGITFRANRECRVSGECGFESLRVSATEQRLRRQRRSDTADDPPL